MSTKSEGHNGHCSWNVNWWGWYERGGKENRDYGWMKEGGFEGYYDNIVLNGYQWLQLVKEIKGKRN